MSSETTGSGGTRKKRPSPLQVSGADRDLTSKARERWTDPTDWRRIIEMSLVLWDAAPDSVEEWMQRMGRRRDQGDLDPAAIWDEFVRMVHAASGDDASAS